MLGFCVGTGTGALLPGHGILVGNVLGKSLWLGKVVGKIGAERVGVEV